jgi:hypothetical protein
MGSLQPNGLHPIDLEMELLKAVTDLAWNEAREST